MPDHPGALDVPACVRLLTDCADQERDFGATVRSALADFPNDQELTDDVKASEERESFFRTLATALPSLVARAEASGTWKRLAMQAMRFLNAEQIATATKAAGATAMICSPTLRECDRCDGCGWYEGGKTLQTRCEVCDGSGVIQTQSEAENAPTSR